jgi:hypothetical protein
VIDFSHRDRRAHHTVKRAFVALAVGTFALTSLALALPLPVVGLTAVAGLGAVGAIYLGWSERMLARYRNDLRLGREGGHADGFLRAEMATPVGLDRDVRPGTAPSPHARRRHPGAGGSRDGSAARTRSGSGQL